MAAEGRDPDSCKLLFLVSPILGDTLRHAKDRADAMRLAIENNIEVPLAQLGWSTNIDFSSADPDAPLSPLTTNGHQSSLAQFVRRSGGKTLREAIVLHATSFGSIPLIGTPDSVAAEMGEVMQEVGGDGFLFALGNVSRRSVAEITDGLVPALQQRGLVRRTYGCTKFRDNLLEF